MASAPRGRREAHRATRRRWYIALLASGLVLAIAGAIVKRGDILYYAPAPSSSAVTSSTTRSSCGRRSSADAMFGGIQL